MEKTESGLNSQQLKELAKIIRTVLENRTDITYIPDLAFPISKEILKHYQSKESSTKVDDKEKQIEICENCKIADNCSHRVLIHKDDCRVNDCDYFQNISIDKEKQIEEMAKELEKDINTPMYSYHYLASKLQPKGWVKLLGNSVVISKEEYEKYQNLKRDVEYSFEYNQVNDLSDGEIAKLKNQLRSIRKELGTLLVQTSRGSLPINVSDTLYRLYEQAKVSD